MEMVRTPQQEAAEDVFFGQIVIITARWFLILSGAILVLWEASDTNELVIGILPVVALMGMNFFLHGRYLVERPANQMLLMLTSLLDLVVITVIVSIWDPGGLANQFYIFYYPMVLAAGFVFRQRIAIIYTLLVALAYAAVSYIADSSMLNDTGSQELLTQRLIVIVAMGGLATYYWRIQRARRRAALER